VVLERIRSTPGLGSETINKAVLSWKGWLAVAIAVTPFVAKRVILLGQHDYTIWLAADYTARAISIFGVVLARRTGLFDGGRIPAGLGKSILVFVAVLIAQFTVQLFVYPVLHANLDYFDLSRFPYIPNPYLQMLDLTFELLFVAISEECVFRALFTAVLERWQLNSLMVITIGAAAFALIHLTSGLADTLNAFLHGLIWGFAYWQTRRLWLCIVSHYLADFYVYGILASTIID
jgi:membrane protease YdiL (CAAX protease family)